MHSNIILLMDIFVSIFFYFVLLPIILSSKTIQSNYWLGVITLVIAIVILPRFFIQHTPIDIYVFDSKHHPIIKCLVILVIIFGLIEIYHNTNNTPLNE